MGNATSILMVPIHLDALSLTSDRLGVEAMADFSCLPYFDGTQDINANIANISEEIVSQPFQNQNFSLKAGIHLHWALPDALTKGVQVPQNPENPQSQVKTIFPTVPNRWLVTRSQGGKIEQQWVVENDYLHPEERDLQLNTIPIIWLLLREINSMAGILFLRKSQTGNQSIAYPIKVQDNDRPWRYLGRKLPYSAWPDHDPKKAQYLESLTAVGYGEPTFAAFYPNCPTVFGLHDKDYSTKIPEGLQYDVIGWYHSPKQDYFTQFIKSPPSDNDNLLHAIQEEFKWAIPVAIKKQVFLNQFQQDESIWHDLIKTGILKKINDTSAVISSIPFQDKLAQQFQGKEKQIAGFLKAAISDTIPEQMVCYGRITFDSEQNSQSLRHASVKVAVGNTGTEALSAYLGNIVGGDRKSIVEDQLEALHLASRLEHRQLDLTAKFKEARHEQGFNAIAAGTMWTIRSESADTTTANAADTRHQMQLTLPDDIAHKLNTLNLAQKKYDLALHELESRRRQLFADWYKYMLSAYPPDGSRAQYPDIDEVKHYLEVKGIAPLQATLKATGNLMLSGDNSGKITAASAGQSSPLSIASQLAPAINQLLQIITVHNDRADVKKAAATYRLQQLSSPRYWQPKEPVVLIAGDAVKPSPRHGQDGRLREDGLLDCQILAPITTPIDKSSLARIRTEIDRLEQSKTGEHIAFSHWQQNPWHPFLLEWEVEVFPIREGSNHRTYNSHYDNQFMTRNYALQENEADLSVQSGKGAILKAANIYSGRSILTPHAGMKLKEQLAAYLQKQILPKYYEAQNIPKDRQRDRDLNNRDRIQNIQDWYETTHSASLNTPEKKAKDPIYTAIRAYARLLSLHSLSQALGGFN